MIVEAERRGVASDACAIAALISERDLRADGARARATEQGAPPRMVLRFRGTDVAPDEAQRAELNRFAAANAGAPGAVVIAQRDALGGETALLGQRRALAVARLLEGSFREVQLRFERDAPAGQVLILREAGTALAPGASGQAPPR